MIDKRIRLTSALGLISLLISFALFYVGIRSFGNLFLSVAIFAISLVALITSFVFIGRLRCPHCGTKLNIEPFPSYNPLPKFFLWTGAEARCGHCHKDV
jgi:hypothetical protein